MGHALVGGQWNREPADRFDPCGRVEPQQCPTGGDALMNLLEESWVTHLVLDQPVGILFRAATLNAGLLGGLLRPVPGGPGFPLQPINLLQFDRLQHVEVADRGTAPLCLNEFQIPTDGWLGDLQMVGNLGLGPALQIQVRDLLAAARQMQ